MKNAFRFFSIANFLLVGLGACTTYNIPVDSIKQQFAGIDHSTLRQVTTRGPAGDYVSYETYPIEVINCVDGKGNSVELRNSPSIEIRFTDTSNKRTIFYFDLMRINGNIINGGQSRFIPSIRKTISLDAIKKIEVQDGKKNFHYVK
jgi:hypothetical protein